MSRLRNLLRFLRTGVPADSYAYGQRLQRQAPVVPTPTVAEAVDYLAAALVARALADEAGLEDVETVEDFLARCQR